MLEGVTAGYALLGDPVEHSPAPAIYQAAFRDLGVDATFVSRVVTRSELASVMREVAATGGGNVTLPHKLLAAAALDTPSSSVLRTGACNCFWSGPEGSLCGDNTDVGGVLTAVHRLERSCDLRLRGARCLVLGAGGAARAVLAALSEGGAAAAEILNRTREKAHGVAAELELGEMAILVLGGRGDVTGPYDLVVNATSLGLRPTDPLPADLSGFRAGAALDVVYRVGGTPWVRHARALGLPAADGLDMLVAQADLSIRNWLGLVAPVEVMRRAAQAALRARAACASEP